MENFDWASPPLFEIEKKEPIQTNGNASEQGSQAWLQWRNKGLGSSDAAVLLCVSPWKTIDQLFQEKLGYWKQEFGYAQKSAMERGQRLEPKIRLLYEAWAGTEFPADTQEDSEHPFMRVSYDGVSRKMGRLIEIKCANRKVHELALMGEVVDYYACQVQWQLMISGLKEADYLCFNGPDHLLEIAAGKSVEERKSELIRLGAMKHMARVRVRRDEAMIRELRHRAVMFWGSIQAGRPCLGWQPYQKPLEQASDQEQSIEQLVADALSAKAELDAADARYEALKEKLKQHLGEREELTVGDGQMRWITRKGAVDYTLVPELKGVDLNNYRKADTRAFEFKRRKE